MRSLRRRTGFVLLALVALGGQMLLSFGHTHAGRETPFQASVLNAKALAAMGIKTPDRPVQPNSDDSCAICWTIGITAAAILSAPAVFAVPDEYAVPASRPGVIFALAGERPSPFDARGPPAATLT